MVILTIINISATNTLNDRIIGGQIVDIKNFPYQVLINFQQLFVCGGALISENKVLSAAHCFQRPGYYSVRLGSSFSNNGGIEIFVRKVIVNTNYTKSTNDYDIAIVFLNQSAPLGSTIRTISLPSLGRYSKVKSGSVGIVSGWGVTNTGNPKTSRVLRAAKIPILDSQHCKRAYPRGVVTERMFCAGLVTGGKDACLGDSGGPFVVDQILYGIVSWGFDCGQPGFPGVYTNIMAVRSFIKEYADL